MWRVLLGVGLLAAAAAGAAWLAERPGDVTVVWQGVRVETSFAAALVFVVLAGVVLATLWSLVRTALRLPTLIGVLNRARKRARGLEAISRGIVAVGAGDLRAARRHAHDAGKLAPREPLTLLLRAQAAQAAGDRDVAERAFEDMLAADETRLLGLRGLHVEARRRGDEAAAQRLAEEAARVAPSAPWAVEAALEYRSRERDWDGALQLVDAARARGTLDKPLARRRRAVLLAAGALDRAGSDPEAGLALALDALKLDASLVPAAALAGKALAAKGEPRRAAKILETAWKANPHPDLARAYLAVRPGDSVRDRLARAERLRSLAPDDPESALTVAAAALAARDLPTARRALEPLLTGRATVRVCLTMAAIEDADRGAAGAAAAREWLARASRAPRDPAWIADGFVSDRWMAVSPVTGRLDAFQWIAPPDRSSPLGGADDVLAALDLAPPPPDAAAPASPAPEAPPALPPAPRVAGPSAPPRPADAARPDSTPDPRSSAASNAEDALLGAGERNAPAPPPVEPRQAGASAPSAPLASPPPTHAAPRAADAPARDATGPAGPANAGGASPPIPAPPSAAPPSAAGRGVAEADGPGRGGATSAPGPASLSRGPAFDAERDAPRPANPSPGAALAAAPPEPAPRPGSGAAPGAARATEIKPAPDLAPPPPRGRLRPVIFPRPAAPDDPGPDTADARAGR